MGKKKSSNAMSPARAARIKQIDRLATLPPIKTSMAILQATKGASPVNKQAVNTLKRMSGGKPVRKPSK